MSTSEETVQSQFEDMLQKQGIEAIYFNPQTKDVQVEIHHQSKNVNHMQIDYDSYHQLRNHYMAKANILNSGQTIDKAKQGKILLPPEKPGSDLTISVFPTVNDAAMAIAAVPRSLFDYEVWQKTLVGSESIREKFFSRLREPGLYVIGGSVGSGKTFSAYNILTQLKQDRRTFLVCNEQVKPVDGVLQLNPSQHYSGSYKNAINVALQNGAEFLVVDELRDQGALRALSRARNDGVSVVAVVHSFGVYGAASRVKMLGAIGGDNDDYATEVDPYRPDAIWVQQRIRAGCSSCAEVEQLSFEQLIDRYSLDVAKQLTDGESAKLLKPSSCNQCKDNLQRVLCEISVGKSYESFDLVKGRYLMQRAKELS